MTLQLTLLAERFAVCRLRPTEEIPRWAAGGPFVSISRTADELSIVCLEASAPNDVQAERGWRCFKVEGPIPFQVTGVAAALTAPLAAAGISLFLISTYDTDYLLVKEPLLEQATSALGGAFTIR